MSKGKRVRLSEHSLIECSRCGKAEFVGVAARDGWNAETRGGRIAAFLCPGCQTDAEHLEAIVNEATIEYTGTDGQGRLTGRSKVFGGGDAA